MKEKYSFFFSCDGVSPNFPTFHKTYGTKTKLQTCWLNMSLLPSEERTLQWECHFLLLPVSIIAGRYRLFEMCLKDFNIANSSKNLSF